MQLRLEEEDFPPLQPDMQLAFSQRLDEVRHLYLREALAETVAKADLRQLDRELTSLVPPQSLHRVAAAGLRGEVFFAAPCLLRARPNLLGYYRLLLGYSAKEFYKPEEFGRFRAMEERSSLRQSLAPQLPALCRSLIGSAVLLVDGLDELSLQRVHELQLLALGPSLRGGELNRIGQRAAADVFSLIADIAKPYSTSVEQRAIGLTNESGRQVAIVFAGDPDVLIREQLPTQTRTVLSIEIKGGYDFSNVYNRIGEAEKSHRSQYEQGCRVFWTLIRARFDPLKALEKSPTTTRFFRLDHVLRGQGFDHDEFRDELCAILGIRTPD